MLHTHTHTHPNYNAGIAREWWKGVNRAFCPAEQQLNITQMHVG